MAGSAGDWLARQNGFRTIKATNIFGAADGVVRWGRIYTELAPNAGGIKAQLARMTGDDAQALG